MKVEKIFNVLVKEIQESEKSSVQKRDDLFRKLGFISLSLLFGLCFSFVFYLAVYYKFLIFRQRNNQRDWTDSDGLFRTFEFVFFQPAKIA